MAGGTFSSGTRKPRIRADRKNADAKRTMVLESTGYLVLRFWNNDVLANTKSARFMV